jgi:hypothetical protein
LSSRKQRLNAAFAAVLAFVVPFALVYFYILNHFYQRGAFFLDSGWLADLMWHKNLALSNPNVILLNAIRTGQHFPPWSHYGIHISPVFSIISSLSYDAPRIRCNDRCHVVSARAKMDAKHHYAAPVVSIPVALPSGMKSFPVELPQ